MRTIFLKIKNVFVYILYLVMLQGLKKLPSVPNPETLLIIRLDAIGDYILFRNFLRTLKESSRFRNYSITLCGNIVWKSLAEELDSKWVDKFIWIDRKKFYNNFLYKYSILKRIKTSGFETVIDTAYSREILYGDSIVRASSAKNRIGSEGSTDSYVTWKRNIVSRNIYTELIPAAPETVFEFCRNRDFTEKVLHEPVSISKPEIDVSNVIVNTPALPYAVLFIGASDKKKIWDTKKFIKTARYLISEYSFNIALAGGNGETKKARKFIKRMPRDKVYDYTGKTTLPQLAKLISYSEILISNESAATHLAASVNKRFICISNGERIKRFHPYPPEIFAKSYYIYPEPLMSRLKDDVYLEQYKYRSGLDVNKVSVKQVKLAIALILK